MLQISSILSMLAVLWWVRYHPHLNCPRSHLEPIPAFICYVFCPIVRQWCVVSNCWAPLARSWIQASNWIECSAEQRFPPQQKDFFLSACMSILHAHLGDSCLIATFNGTTRGSTGVSTRVPRKPRNFWYFEDLFQVFLKLFEVFFWFLLKY